jgi:formate hydrogenlyase subunit 3/multisubunit Na+/H+ antiporter MnhD subunit
MPSVILGMASILMGIFAALVFRYTLDAAYDLLIPVKYINGVLYGN